MFSSFPTRGAVGDLNTQGWDTRVVDTESGDESFAVVGSSGGHEPGRVRVALPTDWRGLLIYQQAARRLTCRKVVRIQRV